MPTAKLYFLGRPHFAKDDRAVELTSAKAIGLLAYLAVTPASSTRERLLDLLWSESPPEAARKNLRNTLWAIRRSLGDDVLNADDERLSISETARVDVRAFETAADQSLDLSPDPYGGPFLDGFSLPDATEFDIWLPRQRERLEQAYLRAVATLVEQRRASGDWRTVIVLAERALAQDSFREPMYRALMEAYARQGERLEALRQYEALRALLDRELGVEPLPETEALRAAILSGALQSAAAPVLPVIQRRERQPRRGDVPQPRFVGRQVERAVLDAELEAARGGGRSGSSC